MTPIGTKSLADLFGISAFAHAHARVFEPGPMTPKVDPNYEFSPDQVRTFLLWEAGITKKKGLLISGPTDCGKSSGVDQFAARTGRQVWRVGCHAKMEWQEVVGCLQFGTDGATFFVPGAVPQAAKAGGILIFEEMNFLSPGTVGAANTMLDGVPISIPETGEVIVPDADFRVCATANAIEQGDDAADYSGTRVMNKALLRRFLTMRAGYLDDMAEAKLLHRVCPRLPGPAIRLLVEVLKDMRASFLAGQLTTPVGHSFACDLARIMEVRLPLLQKEPLVQLERALLVNGMDLAPTEDAKAVIEAMKSKFGGYDFGASNAPANGPRTGPATTTSSAKVQPANTDMSVSFLVNPVRNKTGAKSVAIWAKAGNRSSSGGALGFCWSGTVRPSKVLRSGPRKSGNELSRTQGEKLNSGYLLSSTVQTDEADLPAFMEQAVAGLSELLGTMDYHATRSDVYQCLKETLEKLQPELDRMKAEGLIQGDPGTLT